MHSSQLHAGSSQRTTTTTTATSTPATAAAASARETTSTTTKAKRKTGVKRGSAYTAFMAHELKRVKAQHPEMRHQDVFKLAAANRVAATTASTAASSSSSAAAAAAAGTAQMPADHGARADHRQAGGHPQDDGDGQVKTEHETGSMADEEL
ncbi:hypothetical protein GGF32_007268 [Allomyces javanicus]|nr:hypothetical protein GGF32_007268 [Allomyces javanicus]